MVLDISHASLLNPRKFSRSWTSEDEDKDKDLKNAATS